MAKFLHSLLVLGVETHLSEFVMILFVHIQQLHVKDFNYTVA